MTSAENFYDAVMRLPIVAYQLFLISRELTAIRGLVAIHPYFGGDWSFLMTVSARVAGVIFVSVILLLSITRFRPVGKYTNWNPKITALLGTVFTYLILLTPRSASDVLWDSLSTVLILIGTTMAIMAVLDLGRSMSIMPEARMLVTGGLYGRIRHPLYLAEEIAVLGFCLQFRTWQAAAILMVHLYFQIRRMDWEEGILGEAFPGYAEYKQRTAGFYRGCTKRALGAVQGSADSDLGPHRAVDGGRNRILA
jgi:protein-S-isoprenylcysteine O-methyltransferase Ste14